MAGAGALSLLCACALFAWQYVTRLQTGKWVALPLASFVPDAVAQHPAVLWTLEKLHVGAPLAVLGALLLTMGVMTVLRQNETLRAEERAAADRLRRVRLGQYGDPADRREPYIGVITEAPERTKRAA